MSTRGSPVVETLGAVVGMYVLQLVFGALGLATIGLVAVDSSVVTQPWTLATSVYAHAGIGHLAANAVGIVLFGALVARRTTRARFHGFFLGTGALAGLAEVWIGGLTGPSPAVLGASGAVFALFGYLLAGNLVSTWLLDRVTLSPRVQVLLGFAIAVGLTLATASPGVALIGHATGLLLGLVAGRLGVLDMSPGSNARPRDQLGPQQR